MARNAVFQQIKWDASVRQRAILILCMEEGVGSLVYYLTGAKLTTLRVNIPPIQIHIQFKIRGPTKDGW